MSHFLVVEDDPLIRSGVARAAAGVLEARFAETGKAAIEALSGADLPQFVLLDFLLPDSNGLEIITRLRADARLRAIPIIMFSSLQDPVRKARALEAGANDWIVKPVDPHMLTNVVRGVCRSWGSTTSAASAK